MIDKADNKKRVNEFLRSEYEWKTNSHDVVISRYRKEKKTVRNTSAKQQRCNKEIPQYITTLIQVV